MKILILIISSNGFPYDEYKQLWREYMNLDDEIDSDEIDSDSESIDTKNLIQKAK